MTRLIVRWSRLLHTPRAAWLVFAALVAGTALIVFGPPGVRGNGQGAPIVSAGMVPGPLVQQHTAGVQLTGRLSQTRLVQGDNGLVYLDLTMDIPALAGTSSVQLASDIVVVLDRSGSMAADNKLPYAKEAVRSLLRSLQPDDRFALVTFDSQAAVMTGLAQVDEAARARLTSLIDGIRPGASTNLSDGLLKARALFEDAGAERHRRVLLLSDGEANIGLVDPQELAKLAASLSKQGIVLSTIGMGLGFNETLMAALADYGMGNYSYLEHLGTLGDILRKDLQDARQVFASASSLAITLGSGVTLSEASGYPLDLTSTPGTARISTGQLLAGSKKHVVLTIQVPTHRMGDVPLGEVMLQYTTHHGRTERIPLPRAPLMLTVLAPARQDEAVASIDTTLYQQLWSQHHLGRLQNELSTWLRQGNKAKAQEAITQYRDALQRAEAAASTPLHSPEVAGKLTTMEKDVQDAFSGAPAEQAEKRNRAAKEQHQKALKSQRSY